MTTGAAGPYPIAPAHSLILAGGTSSRMGADKALLDLWGVPQVRRLASLLEQVSPPAYVSVRESQIHGTGFEGLRCLPDRIDGIGPMAGLLAAFALDPASAWLVVAVDLPWLTAATVEELLAARDHRMCATAFRIGGTNQPEPVCAIYEPKIFPLLAARVRERRYSLGLLRDLPVRLVHAQRPGELAGINTPQELRAALTATGK
jgi:molybdopterin-guanine dinucleotide biosynthesis protein A